MNFKDAFRRSSIFGVLFFLWLLMGFVPALVWDKNEQFLFFNQFHTLGLDFIFPFITYLGDGLGVLIVVVIFLFVKFRFSLMVGLSGLITGMVTQILKNFVFADHHRPYYYFKSQIDAHFLTTIELFQHHSFPSGHATSSFALFFSIALIFKKHIAQIFFFTLAVISAYSRVYLGLHFFEDIYIGSIIGSIGAFGVYLFFSKANYQNSLLNKSLIDVAFSNRKDKNVS